MPDDSPEYPPQFASSDISSLLGQIGDFSGNEPPPETRSLKAKLSVKGKSVSARLSSGDGTPVPVTIAAIDAPKKPYVAGLREALIGASIIRLAEQLCAPESAALRERALAVGTDLVKSGGTRLTNYQYSK